MKKIIMLMFGIAAMTSGLVYADDHVLPEPVFPFYGLAYEFEATNPAGVVAALTTLKASATGKAFPGNIALHQSVANGESSATHSVGVYYPSLEAMDLGQGSGGLNADLLTFSMAMRESSSSVSERMFRVIRGKPAPELGTNVGGYQMLIQLEVTDSAGFMRAFDKLWNSKEFASFPGGISFGDYAAGAGRATHFVSFTTADLKSMYEGNDAINGSSAMSSYLKNASKFRNYVGRSLIRVAAVFPTSVPFQQ